MHHLTWLKPKQTTNTNQVKTQSKVKENAIQNQGINDKKATFS